MRNRSYHCLACATVVELPDADGARELAAYQLREWRCHGCRLYAHGRPRSGTRPGISGIPLWLGEQLWGTALLHEHLALTEHLFDITRSALAAAAADEVARELAEDHARATLVRIAGGLVAPLVPPHPRLDGIEARWRSFVEDPGPAHVVVTFAVRPPTSAGMFAFEYHPAARPDRLQLHTCYTVWRALPPGFRW